MTTKLLFAPRRAGLLGWHPRPRNELFRKVPLFVAFAAILLSASTVRLDASAARTLNPARVGAVPKRTNGLAAGDRADFVLFRYDAASRAIQVEATYVSGRQVF